MPLFLCSGISLKTQALYALVFLCRYLDLFWNFASMYNWCMKIIFISTSCAIVYLMRYKSPIADTYDKKADSFNIWLLIVPCAILALFINEVFWVSEVKHVTHNHSLFFYFSEVR